MWKDRGESATLDATKGRKREVRNEVERGTKRLRQRMGRIREGVVWRQVEGIPTTVKPHFGLIMPPGGLPPGYRAGGCCLAMSMLLRTSEG